MRFLQSARCRYFFFSFILLPENCRPYGHVDICSHLLVTRHNNVSCMLFYWQGTLGDLHGECRPWENDCITGFCLGDQHHFVGFPDVARSHHKLQTLFQKSEHWNFLISLDILYFSDVKDTFLKNMFSILIEINVSNSVLSHVSGLIWLCYSTGLLFPNYAWM